MNQRKQRDESGVEYFMMGARRVSPPTVLAKSLAAFG